MAGMLNSANSNNADDEDLFASLGGSLMKDLLADLQVDDGDSGSAAAAGWLSLEQLEQELSQMEQQVSKDNNKSALFASSSAPAVPPSAASMVVNHAQSIQQLQPQYTPPSPAQQQPQQDAWSLSLQKFTSSSLEQEFLQADSARKQQQQQQQQKTEMAAKSSAGIVEGACDYNVQERPQISILSGPPPGLPADHHHQSNSRHVVEQAANQLVRQLQQQQQQQVPPAAPTQHSSVVAPPPVDSFKSIAKPPPITPQNSIAMSPQVSGHTTPKAAQQQQQKVTLTTTTAATTIPPPTFVPPQQPQPQPPVMLSTVPVAVPVASRGPAWQTAPPQQPPPPPSQQLQHQQQYPPSPSRPRLVLCHPHPRAPPVPATALTSQYMSARDISYVVHSIMKSLLLAQKASTASPADDYDVQFWLRRGGGGVGGGAAAVATKNNNNNNRRVSTVEGRAKKAQDWSKDHAALGHVVKTSVARPRALIAAATAGTTTAPNDAERTQLWKARIYADQAYQAYHALMDAWKEQQQQRGQSTTTPQEVTSMGTIQLQLLKLMKCFGISCDNENNTYHADASALQLLLKLHKGKVLLARVLEQALLPPKSMEALLPVALQVLLLQEGAVVGRGEGEGEAAAAVAAAAVTDTRVFAALTRVVETLPLLSGSTLLECVRTVQANSQAALSSTSRMQCVHALLRRGSNVAASSSSSEDAAFQQEWNKAEAEFMNVLAGL